MHISKLLSIYKPAAHAGRLPADRVDPAYRRFRLQVMLSIFFGYAGYYIVRKNFSLAKPYLIRDYGFTTGDVGLIAAGLSVAYGISKFVMGNVSDRSNPRYFMATGLIASGIINLFFGFLPSVWLMAALWFVNGWFQGMGWAPCARTLTHWFSDRERGTKFALWNIAHNVGGGIVGPVGSVAILAFVSWTSVFYVPAITRHHHGRPDINIPPRHPAIRGTSIHRRIQERLSPYTGGRPGEGTGGPGNSRKLRTEQ